MHGCICEVSLVHKGANPGAFIDTMLAHGDSSDDEESAVIYTGMPLCLSHSETKEEETDKKMADEKKTDNEKTVADVIDSMTEEQKNVMYALIGQALEANEKDDESDDDKEDKTVKHNVFDNDQDTQTNVLSHADQADIIAMAKSNSVGSLRTALDIYAEQNSDVLAHGIESIETLFPEHKDVRPGAPR